MHSEKERKMRIKVFALGLLVLALLLSIPSVGLASRQDGQEVIFTPESTPVNGVDCGGNIAIFEEQQITMPEGVTNVFACGTFDGTTLTGSTITSIDPDVLISNRNEPNDKPDEPEGKIRQKGTAYVTILKGELTVVLYSNCASTVDCTDVEAGSKAEISFISDEENAVTTIVLDPQSQELATPVSLDPEGRPVVTLTAGQSIVLINVTVSYKSGSEGALVAASGSYVLEGGEGCVLRCWQFQ